MAPIPPNARRTSAQRAGDAAEAHVAAQLVARGWVVLGRQVRAGRSELDLVAVDPGPERCLVVVEVRWRRRRDFGLPEETLGRLPDGTALPDLPVRLDLVVMEPPAWRGGPPRLRHHRAVG